MHVGYGILSEYLSVIMLTATHLVYSEVSWGYLWHFPDFNVWLLLKMLAQKFWYYLPVTTAFLVF